ncbi:MAG TPA: diguanylate cyclase, partial [Spirochaetia bacterium]|nr:diguanylate cyclase [Spirochaetia bacterium]
MRSERILLVDGESTSASSVTLLLATLGFPPADTAVTADEAVEIAENRLFDLVLFDEKNGERPQTANAAGRIIRHFGIPSIVLTGDAELAARENSRLDAPFGYVRKPVRADELLEAIDRALFRRSVERRLDSKDRWLQAILAGAGDAIIATGVDEVIQFMNPAAGRLTGWPPDEARGIRIDRILRLHEADGNEETELLPLHGRATDSGALADGAMVLTKEQMPIHVDGTMSRIRDRDGNVEGTIFALHDTTLMQRLSDTIDYQANHDALTGLFNRAYFSRRLGALIEQAKAGNSTHALIYLDLDQFKVVNDTWGHLAGDELLRHATSIISTFIRSSDIGARIGSDEFGVLLERISAERARFIAERLKTAITNRKFLWEGKVFSLSSSIGVVTIDAKSNDAYGVLAAANDACYLARDLGGNRIQVYEDEQSLLQKRRGEMEWISKIKWALDEGAFRLYFQPIVPLLDSTLTPKCEILLR